MKGAAKVDIIEEGGTFLGFFLQADYCTEHESGIARLKDFLGIDRTAAPGLPRHSMKSPPEQEVAVLSDGRAASLKPSGGGPFSRKKVTEDVRSILVDRVLRFADADYAKSLARTAIESHGFNSLGDAEAVGAWDDEALVVVAFSERAKLHVGELARAFREGDIALWVGNPDQNPFGHQGLVVAIASRVPAGVSERMFAADVARDTVTALSAATGIEERLRKAGKGFYALTPRPSEGFGNIQTSHPVVYWLNPHDQGANEAGWYSVEELDQWIAGSGPVPKRRDKAVAP